MERVDVAIVGAGPVGAALAARLVCAGRSVRVLEARAAPSRDARTLALSHASRDRLEAAGGWPAAGATPITAIHVSQKGGPGRTLLSAADQGLPALGYTVAYAALEEALERRLADLGAKVSWGAACEAIELGAQAGPVEEVRPLDAGMRIERVYCDPTGSEGCAPLSTIRLGTDKTITSRLTLTLPTEAYYVMVETSSPPAWKC